MDNGMATPEEVKRNLDRPGDPLTCPAAFVVKRDGQQILIGLRHYTPDKFKQVDLWTVPGGRGDAGETVGETLHRETAEEVGITDLEVCDYLGDIPGAKAGDMVPVFVCQTNQEPTLMEPDKFSEWRWSKPGDIPENFINPEAIQMIAHWLDRYGR
jgi:8-oxo-dGTP pyrophosphatase MutT (NUDIX family)